MVQREENNDWRPIASQSFDEILTPPWLRETPQKKAPAPFHFSRLKRKSDLLREKKRRRRLWLMKAYTLAGIDLNNSYDDASISSVNITMGKGVKCGAEAATTHDMLYSHTSDSHMLGSVTKSQLETIYSPAVSRGQTPDGRGGRPRTSTFDYDDGRARTYSAEQGGREGDAESKGERDSISESLAFLSLSEAEHQTSRSLELGDFDPDVQKFNSYLSTNFDGNGAGASTFTGNRGDPVTFPQHKWI